MVTESKSSVRGSKTMSCHYEASWIHSHLLPRNFRSIHGFFARLKTVGSTKAIIITNLIFITNLGHFRCLGWRWHYGWRRDAPFSRSRRHCYSSLRFLTWSCSGWAHLTCSLWLVQALMHFATAQVQLSLSAGVSLRKLEAPTFASSFGTVSGWWN